MAKKKDVATTAGDTTVAEGTGKPEAVDAKVAEAVEAVSAAAENVADLESALVEAKAGHAAAVEAHAALTAKRVIGPRVKLEHSGEIVAVAEGEQRERRLLLFGRNYEHVADFVEVWDEDGETKRETIWVYRHM